MRKLLNKISIYNLIDSFEDKKLKINVINNYITFEIENTNVIPSEEEFIMLIEEIGFLLKETNFSFFSIKHTYPSLNTLKKLLSINFQDKIELIEKEEGSFELDFKSLFKSELYKNAACQMVENLGFDSSKYICINVYSRYEDFNKWELKNYDDNTLSTKYRVLTYTPYALSFLPKTKEDFQDIIDRSRATVEGEVYDVESKKTKKGSIMTIVKITDYNESLGVRFFTDDEIDVKVGQAYEISGNLQWDEWNNVLSLIGDIKELKPLDDVEYSKETDLNGLFDNEELKRCELNVHSIYSTQDGLIKVEDMFKNANNFGIKTVAFCDSENVQAYPEIEKNAKAFGIKPIYGVRLNLIDDTNYKIYHHRNPNTNKKRIISLDIETTGFSGVYDKLIEIAAISLNKDEASYSKLISLDDEARLTNKIQKLTGIKYADLVKDGINIKVALKGLIDYIDNGIIVAHNAQFDIPFIEKQIKIHLGLDIKFSYIDTLAFSRIILKGRMKKFGLDKVCKALKVTLDNHHRATDDAIACGNIYLNLLKLLQETAVEDVIKDAPLQFEIKTKSKKEREALLKDLEGIDYEEIPTPSGKNFSYKFIAVNFDVKDYKVASISHVNQDYEDEPEKLNALIQEEDILNGSSNVHISVLVKNQLGLKELYKLISLAHTKRIGPRGTCVFLSDIVNNKNLRDNIIIGSNGESGIFKTIFNKGIDYVDYINLFDYFEIQVSDAYLSITDSPYKQYDIKNAVNSIIDYCSENKKLICASSNAYYLYPKFKSYRDVYVNTFGVGGTMHNLYGASETGIHTLYSTNNLIKKLKADYGLPIAVSRRLVLDNPDKIDAMVDNVQIVPSGLSIPADDFLKGQILDVVGHEVEDAKDEFIKIVESNVEAYRIEGKLPKYIQDRLDIEMKSIIGHKYHIIYYIAHLLVKQSNKDGYVVGSRGSIGSSFVANLLEITEVNALKPHYRCPHCHYQVYKGVEDLFKTNDSHLRQRVENVHDGFDLEDDVCPICGESLIKDGHDIPFETFLGFDGDKVPDIDLNFSGEYQPIAHNFCKKVFGENYAFRAGTVSTVATKTAEKFMIDYYKKNDVSISQTEIERRAKHIEGVKRTTGQHPAGIIIVPSNMEIYDFTPIQYPANKPQSWFTTHIDYSAIHDNVLKMDILGHDDPTILKLLMDNVHENPNDYPFKTVKEIPLTDKNILKYLNKDEDGKVNSCGIPELGTNFVRGMLEKIGPQNFYQLVQVSGLSHGTDVWEGNAEVLISGKSPYGKIPFSDTISCRDDIMVQLINYKLEPSDAFKIMEFVRKGKASKDKEKWKEYKKLMEEKKVPAWYIDSCEKIKYMFPKAHAVAYVLSALRIAWFKCYRPLDFYQAYFTVRAEGAFNAETICSNNIDVITARINAISETKDATQKDKDEIPVLETAIEMIKRGLRFQAPNINKSHYKKFIKSGLTTIITPFNALSGVGDAMASGIYEARCQGGNYTSVEDLTKRGKANKSFMDAANELNILNF